MDIVARLGRDEAMGMHQGVCCLFRLSKSQAKSETEDGVKAIRLKRAKLDSTDELSDDFTGTTPDTGTMVGK